MPAFTPSTPPPTTTAEPTARPGGDTSESTAAPSVSPRKREARKTEKRKDDTAENAHAVSLEVVADKQTHPGGRKAATDKHATAIACQRAGMTQAQAAAVCGLSPARVAEVWAASGEDIHALQKDLVPRQWKIATLTDDLLLQKLANDGHRMSGPELSIIKGVSIQRACDLSKLGTPDAPPDFSVLRGWAGQQDGGDPDEPATADAHDGPAKAG